MLVKLTYSVTFPTTGRSFNETVHFQGGFGAITGPNEAGKSLIIEMIRWLLFGTAALRGSTSDYKDLKGELDVVIKGVAYKIKRTINSAKVLRDDEELAVGVRPVNNKIVELLGYGLDVFDIAHVANQDELLRLGAMKPTERKRMVDSVIGLGVLDDLAKSAGEEALSLNRRANDLLDAISQPEEPIKPDDYEPSEALAEKVQQLTELKTEYDQLKGWLSNEMVPPVAPQEKVPLDCDSIQALLNGQSAIRAERQALEAQLALLPAPSQYTEEQLAEFEGQALRYEQYMRKARFLSQVQEPQYTQDQLVEFENQNNLWQAVQERKRMEAKIEHLRSCGSNRCPSCGHEWPLEQDQIAELEQQILAIADIHADGPAPLNEVQIATERRKWEMWLSVQDEWNEIRHFPDEAPKPTLTVQQIDEARRANAAVNQRAELVAKIEALSATLAKQPDYATMLMERQKYEAELSAYRQAAEAYMTYQQERREKQARVKELEPLLADLPILKNHYQQCHVYELQRKVYDEAKQKYDDAVAAAEDFKKQAEEWKKVKVALTELRSLVKQHLVPSLNKVASHLLKQMTGGQRQKIEVDEDFNILVDGQAIDTLSGSGKAVANLALRIGLGQVLTNNVFSVFMGDEIDASMDEDRAKNTTNTLQTLMRKISQILLVTHKYPLADYYITLGNNSEEQTIQ